MQEHQPDRRLVAVAFADVAGFSRLVAEDEAAATVQWERLCSDLLIPELERLGGQVIDRPGDALLVAFHSCVRAVDWAMTVQHLIGETADDDARESMQLRCAINCDDVLAESDRLYGDGINITSRIHQAARPGEVVVTSLVRELLGSRLPYSFSDLGTPRLRNIDRIVHLYRVEERPPAEPTTLHQPYLTWSSRPTVAVMPFRTAPPDKSEEYFGEEITGDIIAGLSRSRSFHVVARASMSKYANNRRDLSEVAAELGVEYVLDGSVHRRENRIRINAELNEAALKRSLWAESFDGTGTDIFDIHDQIVTRMVGALAPRLRAAEVDRVRARPTSSLDAYDCVLKALSVLFDFTDESFRVSGIALDRAIALDPFYAQAYAHSAWRLNFVIGEERSTDIVADRARAHALAQKAIALDQNDAFSLAIAGHLTSFVEGRPQEALGLFDTALHIDENSALGWAFSGITLAYLGRAEEARTRLRNAFRLSPFDRLNFSFWAGAGMAEFVDGNMPEAVAWFQQSYRANPEFAATLRLFAAALALAGEREEAGRMAEALLSKDPNFRVSRFMAWYPLRRDEDRAKLERGLLAAGLPP